MRIFIYSTYYPEFLEDFYVRNPDMKTAPYDVCRHALLAEQFGTGDFYSKNLALLGHEAREFVINDESLQKRWALDHGIKYSNGYFQNVRRLKRFFRPNWMEKIILAQIKDFRPDIVYSHNLGALSSKGLRAIKDYARLLVGQVAFQFPEGTLYKEFDLIISSMKPFVERFKRAGIRSEYLRFAFEPSILQSLAPRSDKYDAVFIGALGKNHRIGTGLLEDAAKKVRIDFWGTGNKQLSLDSPIKTTYHGHAWGRDMYQIMQDAKICVNRHIDYAGDYANNMRMFEATGAGTMLITDMKSNLHEFFEIGKEIETYRTSDELAEKISYYLDHETERATIAKAGQERTLREYTYQERMKELADILKRHLT